MQTKKQLTPALPRDETATNGDPASPQQRAALAQRTQQVVERQMEAVERVIDKIAPSD